MHLKRSFFFLFFIALGLQLKAVDSTFLQPISIQYDIPLDADETVKKTVVDYNNRVYVLTNTTLYRLTGHQLAEDILYRPLAKKTPVDLTTQEGTGYLYYLYPQAFLSNANAGHPYGKLPENTFNKIAVNASGDVFLAGKGSAGIYSNCNLQELNAPKEEILDIQAHQDHFYALTSTGVYLVNDGQLKKIYSGNNLQAFGFSDNTVFVGTPYGYFGIETLTGKEIISLQKNIPIRDVRHLLTVKGKLWAGTPQGAFMKRTNGKFRYYASGRWMNDDVVRGMTKDPAGNLYLLTSNGLNQIKFTKQTYRSKADFFHQDIRERKIRYGFISKLRLKVPGDLSTAEMVDTDNDGLWTSFYLASQAYKYAVTGDETAKRYVWESFAAFEKLISINPLKGFPSRTFERTGYKVSNPDEWHLSPEEGWEWKGTTSSDEYVGYIYIAAIMDQLVTETEEEKKRVADFIDAINMHIIENDYNFVDIDGKPTLWGRWHPDYVNSYAKTISDRKLASTDLIAGLELGYALTGKELYKTEAMRLMEEHGYLENIQISAFDIKATPGYTYEGMDMGMGPWNHSDDEMEFLSFWVLYHYAFNEDLKQKFAAVIKDYWEIERPEKHPLWNLITLGTEGSFDKEATLWYLREYPMDHQITWTMKNSIRKDLEFLEPNFRNQYTKEVLSPAERAAHRYNQNEFRLDAGDGGMSAYSGAEYLLDYWLARYLKVINE